MAEQTSTLRIKGRINSGIIHWLVEDNAFVRANSPVAEIKITEGSATGQVVQITAFVSGTLRKKAIEGARVAANEAVAKVELDTHAANTEPSPAESQPSAEAAAPPVFQSKIVQPKAESSPALAESARATLTGEFERLYNERLLGLENELREIAGQRADLAAAQAKLEGEAKEVEIRKALLQKQEEASRKERGELETRKISLEKELADRELARLSEIEELATLHREELFAKSAREADSQRANENEALREMRARADADLQQRQQELGRHESETAARETQVQLREQALETLKQSIEQERTGLREHWQAETARAKERFEQEIQNVTSQHREAIERAAVLASRLERLEAWNRTFSAQPAEEILRELEEARRRLSEQHEQIVAAEGAKAQAKAALSTAQEHANALKQELKLQREEAVRDRLAERQAAQLEAQLTLDETKTELRRVKGELEEQQRYVEQIESAESRIGNRTADELLTELTRERERCRELQEDNEKHSPGDAAELQRLRSERVSWQKEHADFGVLQRESADLRKERDALRIEVDVSRAKTGSHEQRLSDIEHLELRHANMRELFDESYAAMRNAHEQEAELLKSLFERTTDKDVRAGPIKQPLPEFRRLRMEIGMRNERGLLEEDWLKEIVEGCSTANLEFPRRALAAFHTALKAADLSPLTVLAGVSGTGKSLLPQVYARLGGLLPLVCPVRPNWDSPQSLLGFFNFIERLFSATPLLRALDQSARDSKDNDGTADAVHLILLDEMNLAHVELYFSDFLSLLEKRREETADVSLPIDLGSGLEHQVRLGRNVLWVGTINEDETTKGISDKVIDRSNLLPFPRPAQLHRRGETLKMADRPLLPFKLWEQWCVGTKLEERIGPYLDAVNEVNGLLTGTGRALGHRVWQAIERYMSLHPDVIAAVARGEDEPIKSALDRAFEDQFVMRLVPKLRGIDVTGELRQKCLNKILTRLGAMKLPIEDDFRLSLESSIAGFEWSSSKYLNL